MDAVSGLSRKPRRSSSTLIGRKTVNRLGELSRLSLAPHEAEKMQVELSAILAYFAELDKVDLPRNLDFVESAREKAGLRQDIPRPSSPDEILAGVPQKKGRYVRAPRVF